MSKTFNDPIHGHVELSSLAVSIIDTPQFQRLRDISQLGGVYYVFPGAASKRFEHSIGVAHLATTFVSDLRDRQPNLGITDADVLCVQIAGLCHDLGHGPFSHCFDSRVLPQLGATDFCHEHASVQLFELLVKENKLEDLFESHGLGQSEIHFIQELILGDAEEAHGMQPPFVWKGRGPCKQFLYDIVANKRNGIDVDKMDYFLRDTHVLNVAKSFDALRLMRFARVYPVQRDDSYTSTEICFHKKECWNITELFHTRYSLYKRAYLHKVSSGVDMMIAEALVLANDYITVPGKDNKPTRMSECWRDMHAYWRFTEYIVRQIQHSTQPELAPARHLIERVFNRDLFVCVGEFLLKTRDNRKYTNNIVLQALRDIKNETGEGKGTDAVADDDIFVSLVKMGWGTNKNPIEQVAFYLPSKGSGSGRGSSSGAENKDIDGGNGSSTGYTSLPGSQLSFSDLNPDGIDARHVSLGGFDDLGDDQSNSQPGYDYSNGCKEEDVTIGVVTQETLSRLLPTEYEEKYVRVFARHKAQKGIIAAIFKTWIQREMGKDAAQPPLSPIRNNGGKRKVDQM